MKHCIAAAALLLFFTTLVLTQSSSNRGLTLTGSVLGVKEGVLIEIDGKGRAKEKRDANVFDIQLYLQYRNNADKPLIVFLPHKLKKAIGFLEPSGPISEESSAITPHVDMSFIDFDPFGVLLRSLNSSEPARNLFVVIEPQAYYEFRDTVTIGVGYKMIERERPGNLPSRHIISEYPALKIKYHLPVNDRPDVRDALANAKRKWAKFGDLVLSSDGSFEHSSESILNKPSDH